MNTFKLILSTIGVGILIILGYKVKYLEEQKKHLETKNKGHEKKEKSIAKIKAIKEHKINKSINPDDIGTIRKRLPIKGRDNS